MIGYIYKVTNLVTNEFYIGKREYRMDEGISTIYYGSSEIIKEQLKTYGQKNFKKDILEECKTNEDMFERESYYIDLYSDDPLCLNNVFCKGYGGIYDTGNCKKCGKNTVIYNKSGLCMSCIVGKAEKSYCEKCGKETFKYPNGNCRSCASKKSHNHKFCNFCQSETTHFGDSCKHHKLYLKKIDGKIALIIRNGQNNERVVLDDVEKDLSKIKRIDNGKSVVFDLRDLNKEIKSNNKNAKLYGILYNRDVSNWLKITYRNGKRKTFIRDIIVTTDHPLPTIDGVVHRADELKIGDKLIRVNPYTFNQYEFAEIINIEKVEKTSKSYDVTTETEYFDINSDILSHNCRSYLTPDRFTTVGKHKYYGRFNQGVVTLNLVDVALSSEKDVNKFWDLLEQRLELCHRALQERHKRLKGTLSDVAPIMWQYGALARLEPGQVIDDLLYHGYSTISLGYAGIAEMTKYMTDNSHTSEKGKEFALKVMQKLNDKCQEWKLAEDIDYSVYGSPIESGTYRFAKLLQKKFGIIEGITDKNYITNSYHISVTEKIDAFSKLIKESAFQKLSPGGAISYVEVPNLVNNLEAVMSVLECIYENIQYAELNTRSDYCCECKFTGEIPLINEDNKLIWKCPKCGCTNTTKLVITRRTCGYIGTAENGWNQGRLADINNRVLHL